VWFRDHQKIFDEERAAVGDIKVFLMAMLGVKGNRRLGVEGTKPIIGNEELLAVEPPNLQYGWLNEDD
jgi:hypothetical protein